MRWKIYQINSEKDNKNVLFMNYDFTIKKAGVIDPSIYHKVYDGELNTTDIEEIYAICNCNHPRNYHGHSLSVSDIVETEDGICFFCDSIGFKKLTHFDTSNIPETDRKRC